MTVIKNNKLKSKKTETFDNNIINNNNKIKISQQKEGFNSIKERLKIIITAAINFNINNNNKICKKKIHKKKETYKNKRSSNSSIQINLKI